MSASSVDQHIISGAPWPFPHPSVPELTEVTSLLHCLYIQFSYRLTSQASLLVALSTWRTNVQFLDLRPTARFWKVPCELHENVCEMIRFKAIILVTSV